MKGSGVYISMCTMSWDAEGAARAMAAAKACGVDFIGIALLEPASTDTELGRGFLDNAGLPAVCSPGVPEAHWPPKNPEGTVAFLSLALEKTATSGAEALTGFFYGGIGKCIGQPPMQTELDNVAIAFEAAAMIAIGHGLAFGIEPLNRYEPHLINMSLEIAQACPCGDWWQKAPSKLSARACPLSAERPPDTA